jgi:uncharacterized membrane protein
MRTALVALILTPTVISILAMIVMYFPLRSFQRSTPRIRTREDTERLRRLATLQMYGGLLGSVLWIPPVVWIIGVLFTDAITWSDVLLYVILPYIVLFIVAAIGVGPAKAVRDTPADTPALTAERDRIVNIWLSQKLPTIPPGDS